MPNTLDKTSQYDSVPNIHEQWVSARQKKKRSSSDSDSDNSSLHSNRRYKGACCPLSSALNDTINAFREEIKSMHSLLNEMKEEQEVNYVRIKADVSEIKSEILEIKKNIETEKAMEDIENKCMKIGQNQQEYLDCSKKMC
ncbi:unnamed protein product [Parnassius apollo]|uniref:(apollo) hypothetical protein n=1 Tax=Parnassius apollo TaxID=110799 RepID=A0A8S3XQ14_PARAO|nr:unnamed protein product [Parnassius apollo]